MLLYAVCSANEGKAMCLVCVKLVLSPDDREAVSAFSAHFLVDRMSCCTMIFACSWLGRHRPDS
jgi:hypothetical protein